MKKLFCFLLFAGSCLAQISPQITGAGAPTNPCFNGGQQYLDTTNHVIYACPSNGANWVNIGGGNMPQANIRSLSADPSTCSTVDINAANNIYYNTTSAKFRFCSATNTWSDMGGGAGAVSSVSGDGTVITNSASTGAVTLTVAGTSGGVPYFNTTSSWTSSGALTANSPVLGGGAGSAPKTATFLTSNGTSELDIGVVGGGNGVLGLKGTTSGTATLTAPSAAGTNTNPIVSTNALQVPTGGSTSNAMLQMGAANIGLYTNSGNAIWNSSGTAAWGSAATSFSDNTAGAIGWSTSPGVTANRTGMSECGAAATVCFGNGSAADKTAFLQSGMTKFVTSNFTTAANTNLQTITGLSWTVPAVALNWTFDCDLTYSQATANAAVAFGIQAATNAPTNIYATGIQQITVGPPATIVTGTLATLSTTTATNIVSGTPGATGTNYTVHLGGTFELGASANTLNIMVSTATSGDAVTVLRGSRCSLTP